MAELPEWSIAKKSNAHRIWLQNPNATDNFAESGTDGRIKWKTDNDETGRKGVDKINLAQDRDKGRAPVNMVMKLRVP